MPVVDYKKVITAKINADQPEVQISIGKLEKLVDAAVKKDDLVRVVYLSKCLIQGAPQYIDAYVNLAAAQLKLYNTKGALETIKQAFKLKQHHETLFLLAAAAFRYERNLEKSNSFLRKGLKTFPKSKALMKERKILRFKQAQITQNPRKIKAAVVATVKDVEEIIIPFINYHLNIGFSHIFLFFDDPDESSVRLVQKYKQVSTIIHDSDLRARWKQVDGWAEHKDFIDKEVMSRQILNAQIAMRCCLEMDIDWLLHIDSDELFYAYGKTVEDYFGALEKHGISNIIFPNYEAIPEKLDIENLFTDIVFFKKNVSTVQLKKDQRIELLQIIEENDQLPEKFFHCYRNGKSAVTITPFTQTDGVHAFRENDSVRNSFFIRNDAIILHYANCGFKAFWQKYKTLGVFDDKCWGEVDTLPSHRAARDMVATDDMDRAKKYYLDYYVISDKDLLDRLISLSVVVEVEIQPELFIY